MPSGLPSLNAWVQIGIISISQRSTTPAYLKENQVLTVYTDYSNSSIVISPLMIEATQPAEALVWYTKRSVSGKNVYDITAINCNAKFDYEIYEYN